MGRRTKRPLFLIVVTDDLCRIGKDRVLIDAEDDDDNYPEESLLDELRCPLADEVLIALRKSFSLTFPRNPFIDGLQASLTEIRRIGVEALKPMPEVLAELGLKPIPFIIDDPIRKKVYLTLFAVARTADLQISVKAGNRTKRLLVAIDHFPADALIRTLRDVVSDTFSEMHDEDQHSEVLTRIRGRINDVLAPYNSLLEAMEIEPVACLDRNRGSELSEANNTAD